MTKNQAELEQQKDETFIDPKISKFTEQRIHTAPKHGPLKTNAAKIFY